MRIMIAVLAGFAGLVPPQAVLAQGITGRCGPGRAPAVSLGIAGLECSNCTLFDASDPSTARWEFRAEPVIRSVVPDGPAAGRLEAGDVVVSIDGFLATTREGGRRIARPEPDQTTVLRVRRDGRELDVSITPTFECRPAPAAAAPRPRAEVAPPSLDSVAVAGRVRRPPGIAPVAAASGVLPVAPPAIATPVSPELLPPGRFGLSFSCSHCGVENRVWRFDEPPVVTAIEPAGPAARAGIRVGDVILSVDGQSITSSLGGQRFGAIQAGERATLRIRRDGVERTVTLTTAARSAAPGAVAAVAGQPGTVRYSGRLGDTMISVSGEPVVVTRTDTEVVIRSGDITVRLRRDTGPAR